MSIHWNNVKQFCKRAVKWIALGYLLLCVLFVTAYFIGKTSDAFFPKVIKVKGEIIGYIYHKLPSEDGQYTVLIGEKDSSTGEVIIKGRFSLERFTISDIGRKAEGDIQSPWLLSFDAPEGTAHFCDDSQKSPLNSSHPEMAD